MKVQSRVATAAAFCALVCAGPALATIVTYEGTFAPEALNATGSGSLLLEYDDILKTLYIDADWAGLSGTTTNAHIHCCTADPNTGTAGVALAQGGFLPGFPLGVQSGSYTRTIDLTRTDQYNGTFLTGSGGTAALAEARLIANLTSGNAYFNIHTSTFGGGEIRAFVTEVPAAVPEPGSLALVLAAAAVAAGITARRRSA